MNINIKILTNTVTIPVYAKPGDAGFDLCARESVTLAPGEWKAIPSGLVLEIPLGYVGLIWDKSGLSINCAIKTLGGVIDPSYRGEIMIGVINLGKEPYTFEAGHKVAQMLIQKVESIAFSETKNLTETERGGTGFGSSGK